MTSPLGQGIAYSSMTPTMGLISGIDCVMDDILNRVTTASLFYDVNYGYDLTGLVNVCTSNPSAVVGRMEQEILKDPRVTGVRSQSSFLNGALTITSAITLSNGQTFKLIGTIATIPPTSLTFTAAVTS